MSKSSLSSDSSWTLINNSETISKENSVEKIDDKTSGENVTKEILEKQNSFLSFDENSLDKLGGGNTKSKRFKNKKKHKGQGKKKDDSINLLSITACLFAILGITLLTTLLPQNLAESAKIEQFQTSLVDVYEKSMDPTDENVTRSFQTTIETLDSARDFFGVFENNSTDPTCAASIDIYPNSTIISDVLYTETHGVDSSLVGEFLKEEENSASENSIVEKLQNKTKLLFQKAKSLVKSVHFQTFIATLLQDICLIKLINEVSKKAREAKLVEKKPESVKKSTKKVKSPRLNTKIAKKNHDFDRNEVMKKKKSSNSTLAPFLDQETIKKINSIYKNNTKLYVNENGKSECERRFEELDTRWATMGYNHRQKIQQIKNKFQEEILLIKEREKETYNRKQKISFTREKYIQRLKADRDIYLHKLRRLREERQIILKNVCSGFSGLKYVDFKDASVGNYAVLMPSSNDFYKTLQQLKDKESVNNSTTLKTNNDPLIFNAPEEKCNDFGETRVSQGSINKYCELKRKYLKKKIKQMRKRRAQKEIKEVNSTVKDIIHGLSEATSKLLQGKGSDENKTSPEDLYFVAFEDQSKHIKEQDDAKWRKKNDDLKLLKSRSLIMKADPSKYPKMKIIHKGVL